MASECSVAFVVLAAGGSRRLGRPKQLLPFRGRTLLRHAVEVAVEAASAAAAGDGVDDPAVVAAARGRIVVVLGADAERMHAELQGLPVDVAVNADWASGLSFSVRAGLDAAGDAGGVLFVATDQPFVTADLLRRVVAAFRAGAPIVACAYAGTLGVPALFDRTLFGELASLEGDAGARRVIERHRDVVRVVAFERGAADVDTQDDWESLH